ncbi:hypothetical protein MTO96_013411 [Rhipicephalus appendiculatus]
MRGDPAWTGQGTLPPAYLSLPLLPCDVDTNTPVNTLCSTVAKVSSSAYYERGRAFTIPAMLIFTAAFGISDLNEACIPGGEH